MNDKLFFYVRVAEALHRPANPDILYDSDILDAVSQANNIRTNPLDDVWVATAAPDERTDVYRTGRSQVEAIWNVVLALDQCRRLVRPARRPVHAAKTALLDQVAAALRRPAGPEILEDRDLLALLCRLNGIRPARWVAPDTFEATSNNFEWGDVSQLGRTPEVAAWNLILKLQAASRLIVPSLPPARTS